MFWMKWRRIHSRLKYKLITKRRRFFLSYSLFSRFIPLKPYIVNEIQVMVHQNYLWKVAEFDSKSFEEYWKLEIFSNQQKNEKPSWHFIRIFFAILTSYAKYLIQNWYNINRNISENNIEFISVSGWIKSIVCQPFSFSFIECIFLWFPNQKV